MRLLKLLDELTMQYLSDEYFRGVVIRIEHMGDLVLEKAWGSALWDGAEKLPMQTDYLFDLASLSKLYTATAILKLISDGRLCGDTPINEVLGFGNHTLQKSLRGVDIASLLSHSTGIHYWYPFYTRADELFPAILADVLSVFPCKAGTVYSDLNFILLGLVIERLSGKRLREAMKQLVFTPLGLNKATYDPPEEFTVATEFGNLIEKQMVRSYGLQFSGWREDFVPIRGNCNDGNCYYFFGGAAGHAGIFADAADVARLGRVYLDNSCRDGSDYLDPALLETAVKNNGSDRGYGFQFGKNYPNYGYGHTGFTGTYLHVNPSSGLTITILTNRLHVLYPKDISLYRQKVSSIAIKNHGIGQSC